MFELLLVILFEGFMELIVSVLFSIPFYAVDYFVFPGSNSETRFGKTFLLIFSGALVGYLSLLIYPHALLTIPLLRVINLGLAPLTSAYIIWFTSRLRGDDNANQRFWYAFLFTFGVALARLIWAGLN